MNKKKFGFIAIVFVLFFAGVFFEKGLADEQKTKFQAATRVGVVNVRLILQSCDKHAEFMQGLQKEVEVIKGELKVLAEDIANGEKALNTRVKGSPDYYKMARELMEKEASLEARREFQKNLMALKEKQWTEDMYQVIHRQIEKTAKDMGVDIVVDGNADLSLEIPAISPNELVLTIRTRKVLYFNNSVDITNEVLAAVNSVK